MLNLMGTHLILRAILFNALMVLATFGAAAQSTLFVLDNEPVCIEQDAKGFFFIADEHGTLAKYSSTGKRVMQVNIKVFGVVSKIDCQNPFEVYTYHKDQNIVVFYDNMLNIKGSLSLNNHYLTNVVDVARSFDNKLWLFDQSDLKLKKVLKAGNTEFESPNLSNILNKEVFITEVREFSNSIYLLDTLHGIHVFDAFGTFVTTHYLKHKPQKWILIDNVLVYQEEQKLYTYNIVLRSIQPILDLQIDEELIGANGGIYTLMGKKVKFYKLD